jgi:imidazolonepropionase-like amidohydrolase
VYAVRAARSFDGHAAHGGGVTVLVKGGRIAGVESGHPAVGAGWQVLDYPDSTVLPGLVDAHVHLGGDGADDALDRLPGYSGERLGTVIKTALRRQLAAGVTTVRDLGDRDWSVVAWRDRQRGAGLAEPLPEIVASGPPLTSPGGHCWAMGGQVDGPEAMRAAIGERADRHVDIVKIMVSGGAMTAGTDVLASQFTLPGLRAAVSESHRLGLPVTAHAHGVPAVEIAVAAGVDGIEHCSCLTGRGIDMPDALLDAIVTSGIEVCPTLGKAAGAVLVPRIVEIMRRTGLTYEKRQEFFAGLGHRGVRLVSGSDAGISSGKPHGILPGAVADLAGGGLPARDALATATSAAARACGVGDRKGQLKRGFDADLLVVAGDPLADLRRLAQVSAVIVQGTAAAGSAPGRDPDAGPGDE